MSILAVIPARGGSKRIPGKNMKKFLGKEIISYPIEVLQSLEFIDSIFVSTDSTDIQEYATQLGASCPVLRSDKNSSDHATTFDVVSEVLHTLGRSYDLVICVYPTSIFVTDRMVIEAVRRLENDQEVTSVCTMVRYKHPIQRAFRLNQGAASSVCPEYYNTRTQDLEQSFHDAGQLYVFRPEAALSESKLITSRCTPIVLDDNYVQDIDEEQDWSIAEAKFLRNINNG